MTLTAIKYVEHFSVATPRGTVRLSHYLPSATSKGYWSAGVRELVHGHHVYREIDRANTKAGALVRINIWANKGASQ
jgi:hypothetical protein